MTECRALAQSLARGDPTPTIEWKWPVHAAFRRRGIRLWDGWSDGGALGPWLDRSRRALRQLPDRLEISFPTEFMDIDTATPARAPPSWGGIFGLEVSDGDRCIRLAPAQMIAANVSWARAVEACRVNLGAPRTAPVRIRRFRAEEYLVALDASGETEAIARAGRPVGEADVSDAGAVAGLARLLGNWMVANTGEDGRLVYKYWPSRGAESTADNTVRQFMGTVALQRYARWAGDAGAADAARRNLDRQIATYFRPMPDGTGVIELGGSAKLGAAALAGLAILEAEDGARHARILDALAVGIERLWRPDGAFRTFHFPAERNDNQNFYPGEAALFWAHLYARRRDDAILARLRRTLDHYRDWHRARRNPAFVPWHAQAHVAAWEATGDAERIPFVFEMIDWLLPMQQWDGAPAADMRGRFYDPAHREWGPPHAASTGAYLEGIAVACRLARALGDHPRAARYAESLRRGFRNIRQLVFADPVDLFYVSRRRRTLGGVRTEVYDNTIRLDNVQHALMALLDVLRHDTLGIPDGPQGSQSPATSGTE